jgi:GxxExxY protein
MGLETEFRAVTGQIVDAASKVHSALGPGLLEKVNEVCLAHELRERGLRVACQVPMPVRYRGVTLDIGYRIDVLVEEAVVVEVKAVGRLHAVHSAPLLSYMKLNSFPVGLLFNFHSRHLKDAIIRLVN